MADKGKDIKLTSVQCIHILQNVACKACNVLLNRTQALMLLYIWYGEYMKRTGVELCINETPEVWPQGPVFPIAYESFFDERAYRSLDSDTLSILVNKNDILDSCVLVLTLFGKFSASELSSWARKPDGAWAQTIVKEGDSFEWKHKVDAALLKDYFSKNWYTDVYSIKK